MIVPSSTAKEERVRCAHCGDAVPRGLVDPTADRQFCCHGCRAVWDSLHACGLARYYELRQVEEGSAPRPVRVTERAFAHLDTPEFLARHARAVGDDRTRCELRVDGLHCGACVWLLESLPKIVPGLVALRVNLAHAIAEIDWSPASTSLSAIARRLDRLGYQLAAVADPDARLRERMADRAWFARIGVAGALAANAMAIAFALYGGLFSEMAPIYRALFQWCAVALCFASLAGPGRIFFANAWTSLRTRTPHMDVPVALGIAVAFASGAINTVRGSGSIYCESAAMLVFLLLVGRFVQFRQQRRARQEIELLSALVPAIARRVEANGEVREVPIEALEHGVRVAVPAGEVVPCDGTLRSGAARMELALLTGESRPVLVESGSPVWAGTRPVDRPIEVEVAATGEATRAGRLVAMVAEASARRPRIVQLADRIAGWFLVGVLAAAALTCAYWWSAGADAAISRAVALLVVSCPCALGLATPLAVVAGLGRAARSGVLVRGGDVLERLDRVGTIVLDKTGTLTRGRVGVSGCVGAADVMGRLGALERASAHPIARAIVESFAGPTQDHAVSDVRESAGRGIEGVVDGRSLVAGSARLIASLGMRVPGTLRAEAARAADRGESPVLVAEDGAVCALVTVGDAVRPDARPTVAALRRGGWNVRMASGDDPAAARAVGHAVGLLADEVEGGASPERKLEIVRASGLRAPVVMIGDGVNDLAAMAAADVGVAVREGAQSALSVADVCLASVGIAPVLGLVRGARRTMHAVRLGLAVSVAYNVAGATLAFLGLVNPLVAAVLMPVSSLTVVGIALAVPRCDLPERVDEEASR